jgi:benzodiazapine receptor
MNKWIKLIISILICILAGVIGSVFTTPSIPTWYAGLNKPSFSPPNWAFAPIWTTLYILMGVSLYIVIMKSVKKVKTQIAAFGIQLALNVIWSLLFFGLKSPSYAFAEIIALWMSIAVTIVSFYKVSKGAAALLVPYILWVSIATLLNYYILILN